MTDAKGNTIVGAFDDLLVNPTIKRYALLDYKTKGSPADQPVPSTNWVTAGIFNSGMTMKMPMARPTMVPILRNVER